MGATPAWTLRHRRKILGAAAIISFGILYLRNPGALAQAALWGEDGWYWYPQAYASGLRSLLIPHTGYLQSFPRLISLVALAAPLRWTPTLFAAVAMLVEIAIPVALLSRRLDGATPGAGWRGWAWRCLACLIYLLLPNSAEEFGNLTNSQWHLALLSLLVLASAAPRTVAGRVLDCVVLLVAGLSGPFCMFLAPFAALAAWRDRSRDRLLRVAVVCATGLLQGVTALATAANARPKGVLGASMMHFADLFGVQVELAALLGKRLVAPMFGPATPPPAGLMVGLTVAGLLACGVAAYRGGRFYQGLVILGALTLAAALVSPVVPPRLPAWVVLTYGGGQRYFLLPMLALLFGLLTLACDRGWRLRIAGTVCLLPLVCGIYQDWASPKFARTDFDRQAQQFAAAPAGTTIRFQVNPTGMRPMVLTKRQASR